MTRHLCCILSDSNRWVLSNECNFCSNCTIYVPVLA